MPKVVHHLFKSDEKHLEQIEESLLLGASDLAKHSSIENIQIEDVVNQAQVSKSTFYKVFNSVDSLFKRLGQKLTNEITAYALSHTPVIPDLTMRVSIKTKRALHFVNNAPFLASLLIKAEWPSSNPSHMMYKDIEKDLVEGIKQGYFSDVSPSIGVNLILGCLRGAVKDILEKQQSEEYINQIAYQILISLGVDQKTADAVSKSPILESLPVPPIRLVSNALPTRDSNKAD
jgi:AcrR family transcriptional regulator